MGCLILRWGSTRHTLIDEPPVLKFEYLARIALLKDGDEFQREYNFGGHSSYIFLNSLRMNFLFANWMGLIILFCNK